LVEEKTGFNGTSNHENKREQRHPEIKILTSQTQYSFALTRRIGSADERDLGF